MIYIGYWLKHPIHQKQKDGRGFIKRLIYGKYVSSLVTNFSYMYFLSHVHKTYCKEHDWCAKSV